MPEPSPSDTAQTPKIAPRVAAVLLAAGSGARFGGAVAKQYRALAGKAVLRRAAEALGNVVVQPVGDADAIGAALAGLGYLPPVPGGATRQESVRAGLEALAAARARHRAGARRRAPLHARRAPSPALLARWKPHAGAIPALPVADTLKRGADGRIAATVPRDGAVPRADAAGLPLRRPPGRCIAPAPEGATDDASLLEAAGLAVALVAGHRRTTSS